MFGRRKSDPAPNLAVELIPVFGPDPRGAALFHGVTAGNASRLNGPVRIDARGDGTWGGWTKAPQVPFAPAGRLGSGRPVVDPNGMTIDQANGSVISDPVQRAFTERMAARGRS
jgi:hypothetical protein